MQVKRPETSKFEPVEKIVPLTARKFERRLSFLMAPAEEEMNLPKKAVKVVKKIRCEKCKKDYM